MKTLYGMNFKECVLDYVTCLDKPPNGHGQNYSEKAGGMPSHFWLGEIYKNFGKEKTQKEIEQTRAAPVAAFFIKLYFIAYKVLFLNCGNGCRV